MFNLHLDRRLPLDVLGREGREAAVFSEDIKTPCPHAAPCQRHAQRTRLLAECHETASRDSRKVKTSRAKSSPGQGKASQAVTNEMPSCKVSNMQLLPQHDVTCSIGIWKEPNHEGGTNAILYARY